MRLRIDIGDDGVRIVQPSPDGERDVELAHVKSLDGPEVKAAACDILGKMLQGFAAKLRNPPPPPPPPAPPKEIEERGE